MNPLLRLAACGQSYWLDNLTRGMIKSGALQKRVTEEGLRGITSNPNTFHKAIATGSDYDTQIQQLVAAFADHGVVRENSVEADLEEAWQTFQALDALGVNFDCVTWQLENEGVQKFIEPFDELMRTLKGKS